MRRIALGAAVALALVGAGAAAAAGPEAELADKFAPVLRLVAQTEECGHGEPFEPIDVDLILPDNDVALRGPWDTTNVVKVAPTAEDLADDRFDYALDYPGDPLDPKCDYEQWSKRITAGSPSTAYAHVVTQPGVPGKLALQYWFFYVFNDFNNKHEGDWEMIQLNFDAPDAEAALASTPVEVGYSQHEGAESADWGSSKLQLVDGTHPVVYPAAGSHANYYKSALFLGRSASQGVGCDDTVGPSREVAPRIASVPSDRAAYLAQYPWLGYEGQWGEKQPSFYNGPTGPNLKTQWTEPFTWAEESWRDEAFAVPVGQSIGPTATDFFCTAVGAGSNLLTRATANPLPVLLGLLAIVALLLWAASRTSWARSAPLRLARRRRWGELVTAAWAMYRQHPGLFIGIGVLFIPLSVVISAVQYVIFRVTALAPLTDAAGETNAFIAGPALILGVLLTVAGLTLVQAAAAAAMREIDEGRPVTARHAYGLALRRLRPLLGGLVRAAVLALLLDLTVIGIPVALWLIVRWSLLAQVVQIEGHPARGALRRSASLVKDHWPRTASITIVVTGAGIIAGPLIGALMLFVTTASFTFVNLIAGLVYMLTMPLAAIATTYLYYDLRTRDALEPATDEVLPVLPAELVT